MINKDLEQIIMDCTGATELHQTEIIQELWSGYGNIIRYKLEGSELDSVVVKHINLISINNHPRGWNTDISHNRKIKSYLIEMEWYEKWSNKVSERSPIPKCLSLTKEEDEFLIVLEDLDDIGYTERKTSVSIDEMKLCLKWLANFHINFIGRQPEGLWDIGCYWHLETRPDELNVLTDKRLKKAAPIIENKLHNAKYITIVHGDAKLANFCFSKDGTRAAMVDFQYVGGGPGIKDVAYFIGSCLYEEDCEKYEADLLNYYFDSIKDAITEQGKDIDAKEITREWRELYPVAWCDFHRFLKGWSPGHWKINSYSERLTQKVLKDLGC